MGVALARGIISVDIRANSMKDNGGLGIDWELDGPSPVDRDDREGRTNPPVLLYGYYDAATNTTIVAVTAKGLPLGSTGALNFYANDAADGDGERHLVQIWTKSSDQAVIASLYGDRRGQWINATWTRTASFDFGPWMTSELSNTIHIE